MRQISDVEIDDGIFMDPYFVFTIFPKNPIELSTTNVIENTRKVFIDKCKPTLTKEEEKNHTLSPQKEIKL